MANNTYVLKTRPSHLSNIFYYLILGVIFYALWSSQHYIGEFCVQLISLINTQFIHKDQAFVITSAKILLNVILFIPTFFAAYRFIKTELNLYYFYEDRLVFYVGLANRHKENVELYRVKDHYVTKPLHLRIFGLSTLVLISTDRRHPTLKLNGFRHIYEFEDELRVLVEKSKDSGKGREVDMV